MVACKKEEVKEVAEVKTENFKTFGDSISADGVISKEDLLAKYETLKEGDTIEVKFRSDIKDVCQKKGCWMNMSLNEDKNAFVRFKDYGFFMPLNAAGSEAIVNGKAFISVETVDELKHYAKDAGKSQAAIDSITEPKVSYSFLSNGVLIKE
ncbi:MAG TPA: DUF4920 domain-containing protein [Flavobacterium sp.]|nr:DUF4920 domain-containing protein [Flavobacterium sp.]